MLILVFTVLLSRFLNLVARAFDLASRVMPCLRYTPQSFA
jgi:hypothetical protein